MAGRRRPVGTGQELWAALQPIEQLGQPQRLDAGSRQLDGQRHPVQALHQPGGNRSRFAVQDEPRISLPGPVREQPYRRGHLRVVRYAGRQRPQPEPDLAGQPDGFTAGGQDPDVVGGGQHRRAQLRDRGQHVLAVVQDQQQLLAAQHRGQRLGHRQARSGRQAQPGRDHRRHLAGVRYGGQLHQPRPIGETARHQSGHLAGQPGLTHATRSGHSHQAVPRQQRGHLSDVIVAADETGQGSRKAMRGAQPG